MGALVMLGDFADRAPRVLADGEVFATGRRRLRFVSTPHLPHGWDAGLHGSTFRGDGRRALLDLAVVLGCGGQGG